MKKRQFLALTMALSMAAAVGFTSIPAHAAGLTQAESPDDVNYGQVSEADMELLKSLFDLDFYVQQNPDLAALYGTDYDKLFEHFCTCGVFEGRSCNPNFDPSAYASAYSDLKDLFGTNILKYYEHYAAVGASENRNLTTLKSCAEAGITVHPINNEKVSITPRVYNLAVNLGVTNIKEVSQIAASVERAAAVGGTVIVSHVEPAEAMLEAKGLEVIGTVKIGEGTTSTSVDGQSFTSKTKSLTITIVKGNAGYAAYDTTSSRTLTDDSVPVYTTDDYEVFVPTSENPSTMQLRFSVSVVDSQWGAAVRNRDLDVSYVDEPHYKTYGSIPTTGVFVDYNLSHRSGEYSFAEVGTRADKEYTYYEEIDGYYTDTEANWTAFATPEEREAKIMGDWVQDGGGHYSAVSSSTYYVDEKGTTDTEYTVGMEINEDEETGKVNVSVGVYNEADNFGVVNDFEIVKAEQD